jgi:hypothetical protein
MLRVIFMTYYINISVYIMIFYCVIIMSTKRTIKAAVVLVSQELFSYLYIMECSNQGTVVQSACK